MSYNILTIPPFDKNLKKLAKKYTSLKQDFSKFLNDLEKNPSQGVDLGKNCYKIRLKISSKNKRKSGGARIITHVVVTEGNVYLLAIYDKSDKDTLTDSELKELLQFIL